MPDGKPPADLSGSILDREDEEKPKPAPLPLDHDDSAHGGGGVLKKLHDQSGSLMAVVAP